MILSRFFMYALLMYHCFDNFLTCVYWVIKLDIMYSFIMWFGCHGSWLWMCPLQQIHSLYSKIFFVEPLGVIQLLEIWHYSFLCLYIIKPVLLTLSSSLVVWTRLCFVSCQLCCILWEASGGENIFIMPLV